MFSLWLCNLDLEIEDEDYGFMFSMAVRQPALGDAWSFGCVLLRARKLTKKILGSYSHLNEHYSSSTVVVRMSCTQGPGSRTPNSGLQYPNGVGYRALKRIYLLGSFQRSGYAAFLDPCWLSLQSSRGLEDMRRPTHSQPSDPRTDTEDPINWGGILFWNPYIRDPTTLGPY